MYVVNNIIFFSGQARFQCHVPCSFGSQARGSAGLVAFTSLGSGLCHAPAPWAVPAGTEQDLCRVPGLQMWFSLSEK